MHLLIPFAACSDPACQQVLPALPLPHLARVLNRLTPDTRDAGDDYSLSMPHERALARMLGLPADDGLIPWVAWEAQKTAPNAQPTPAHARITPCHWQLATDHFIMDDPAALQLEEAESRTLLEAIAPFFAEDGIKLAYVAPTHWNAQGDLFRHLATASLDRVCGRSLDIWMPEGEQARPLRRLQSEMQMLLYTHPVNEAREARGQMTVNAFWISGAGALPAPAPSVWPADLHMPQGLRGPALRADWKAWAEAWQQIDATECAALLAHLEQGRPATLTLCGERHAQSFTAQPRTLWNRLSRVLTPQRPDEILKVL